MKRYNLLNPVVLTTCNDCFEFQEGEHREYSSCGSDNVEVVREDDAI